MPVASGENLEDHKERAFEVLEAQTTPILQVVNIRRVASDSERVKTLHPNNRIQVPIII